MKSAKILIVAVQLLVMVNAFGGGYYGLAGARGIDPRWLEGSPFGSFLIPSLFLLIVIGGGMAVASILWLVRSPLAPWGSVAIGVTLMSWILVQVAIIGYVSPLQPISFVAGAAIAALALATLRGARVAARAQAA